MGKEYQFVQLVNSNVRGGDGTIIYICLICILVTLSGL